MYELRKRHKNSRNGSFLLSVYLAEVKAVAFAVISSGYRSQFYFTLTQTNAILDDTVYTIPRSTIYIRAGYE